MTSQQSLNEYLQGTATAGATANGNGTPAITQGFDGAIVVEVIESAGGTCTLQFQGAFDGTAGATWYALGYQQIDNTAAPARAVANLSVTANMKHVYLILDKYPQTRAVVSAVAGGCTVTVRVYALPS